MGDQIVANGIVDICEKRDFEFCADAVRAGYEDRFAHVRKHAAEHAAEAANVRKDIFIERCVR